jgi:hypothetical protein
MAAFLSDPNAKEEEQALMTKLRWCTLGFHHNWDTKVKFGILLISAYLFCFLEIYF